MEKITQSPPVIKDEVVLPNELINESIVKFDGIINEKLEKLQEVISELAGENNNIKELPEKLKLELQQLVPSISNSIQQVLLQDLEVAIAGTNASIQKINQEIILSTEEAQKMKLTSLKKTALILVSIITISVFTSASATYYLIKDLPKKIIINSEGNINIDKGNISIWQGNKKQNSPSTK